ncbi:unnamed protein product [Lactuca saligna]|uniref:Uncharacterized protein n=1 Tax=Lactuca saligna TaxID=75948 RepID=A0AA35VGD1_LACSI|nr:unnamed protein product [Lactuca saligna]
MSANALGLTMESNEIRILEPFDTSIKFSTASGKKNIYVAVSDIFMNFSFSTLQLFLAVEEDILRFLRMTSRKMMVSCSDFDKLDTFQSTHNNQTYAFWRPHAPLVYQSVYHVLKEGRINTDATATVSVVSDEEIQKLVAMGFDKEAHDIFGDVDELLRERKFFVDILMMEVANKGNGRSLMK